MTMAMAAVGDIITITIVIAALTALLIGWSPSLLFPFRSWRIRLVCKVPLSGRPRGAASAGNRERDLRAERERFLEQKREDLRGLLAYIDEKDGGPPWRLMMDRSTPTLAFRAWFRDPEFGPTQYRTQTVIENVVPELLRDFFWDDEFRTKWDNMLAYFRTLWECPHTGMMIVQWIRKFPFFCSDREYIVIRRIWELEMMYYCVSKGIPYPSIPRHRKPRRVDFYYSSWRIRSVESRNGGNFTASEVLLFHYEEMNIPKMLAKIGIQRGMWGLVMKMDLGVQAYQMARANGAPPSRYARGMHRYQNSSLSRFVAR